jgi:hypothetical protein
MPPKDENVMRLVLQNIHGAPLWSSLADNNNFRESFEYTQSDVYAMTEMNTHWRNLPHKDKLHERMVTWFEARHESIAYNLITPLKGYGNMEAWV